jgi:GNAT superfamily N-acetyltransferase
MNGVVRWAPVRSKSYKNNLLFRKDLHRYDSTAPRPEIPGFEFVRLEVPDTPVLERCPDALPADDYRRRLEAGHTCFCAKIDRGIAGYNWLASDRVCHRFGSPGEVLSFSLAKDTAFLYDFFVFRGYRGRGVGTLIKRRIFDELKQRGFRYVLFCVDPWNTVAIKLALKMGCEPQGMEHVYRIGNWQKWYLGTTAEARGLESWCQQFKEGLN